ncbi:MAG: hypothetical protein PF961_00870 [Planctomycetota bacterium]|jgi:hypothetical protein|nr:hypothetical protein [Planctomycetota bacterium]
MVKPQDLWFIIKLDATEPGTWPLVRYDNQVTDQEGSQGWIEIGASQAVVLPRLSPESGSITIDAVALATDGSRQPTRLRGHFEGTFFSDDGGQFAVNGSFDFER